MYTATGKQTHQKLSAVGCIGLLASALVLQLIISALMGVVLVQMWAWFVVPMGVPPINSLWHAVGLALVVSIVAGHVSEVPEGMSYTQYMIKAVIGAVTRIGILYLLAAIAVSLM